MGLSVPLRILQAPSLAGCACLLSLLISGAWDLLASPWGLFKDTNANPEGSLYLLKTRKPTQANPQESSAAWESQALGQVEQGERAVPGLTFLNNRDYRLHLEYELAFCASVTSL